MLVAVREVDFAVHDEGVWDLTGAEDGDEIPLRPQRLQVLALKDGVVHCDTWLIQVARFNFIV